MHYKCQLGNNLKLFDCLRIACTKIVFNIKFILFLSVLLNYIWILGNLDLRKFFKNT